MPTITLYGGAGTIGGNKILLEDGDSRLFFDFGTTRQAVRVAGRAEGRGPAKRSGP